MKNREKSKQKKVKETKEKDLVADYSQASKDIEALQVELISLAGEVDTLRKKKDLIKEKLLALGLKLPEDPKKGTFPSASGRKDRDEENTGMTLRKRVLEKDEHDETDDETDDPKKKKKSTPLEENITPTDTPQKAERKYVCDNPGCDAVFTRAFDLKRHKERRCGQTEKKFLCPEPGCGMRYFNALNLKEHHAKKHEKKALYECKLCHAEFFYSSQITLHKKSCKGVQGKDAEG
jgi:hypothetical protein